MAQLKIGNRYIGDNYPTFIIAEVSANHGHDIEVVKKMVVEAKNAGADAIKLQTYTADTLTIDSSNEYFKIKQGTLWDGETLYDLYKRGSMPWEWHDEIFKLAKSLDIICFSTPFDYSAVDFLTEFDVPAYKIASFEITDIPLIEYTASKQKPMFMSLGIATFDEINEAVNACYRVGNRQIVLLKCTSAYPSPLNEMNLKMIPDISSRFNTISGISDHSKGNIVPIASVALGAAVIEKHFILDRDISGSDASFSLDLDELKEMILNIRETEIALGKVDYALSKLTKKNREFSRSLFIVQDVAGGEMVSEQNVRSIRPGYGISPKYLKVIMGKKFLKSYKKGTPVSFDQFE